MNFKCTIYYLLWEGKWVLMKPLMSIFLDGILFEFIYLLIIFYP